MILFNCFDLGSMYWFHCSVQINSFLCIVGAQKPTGTIAKPSPAPAQVPFPKSSEPVKKTLPPKVMDINAKQVCKHKGCGNTFTEKENHESACSYHPGPAVFHDRQKGVCCFIHCDSWSIAKIMLSVNKFRNFCYDSWGGMLMAIVIIWRSLHDMQGDFCMIIVTIGKPPLK